MGSFRVVPEHDLDIDHDTLEHLRDQGLVETVDLSDDERGLTLAREGRLRDEHGRLEIWRVILEQDLKREYQEFLQARNRGCADSDGGPALARAEPRFFVESATLGMRESRDPLRRWLLLHPPGTRFNWEPSMSSFPWFRGSLSFPGES